MPADRLELFDRSSTLKSRFLVELMSFEYSQSTLRVVAEDIRYAADSCSRKIRFRTFQSTDSPVRNLRYLSVREVSIRVVCTSRAVLESNRYCRAASQDVTTRLKVREYPYPDKYAMISGWAFRLRYHRVRAERSNCHRAANGR